MGNYIIKEPSKKTVSRNSSVYKNKLTAKQISEALMKKRYWEAISGQITKVKKVTKKVADDLQAKVDDVLARMDRKNVESVTFVKKIYSDSTQPIKLRDYMFTNMAERLDSLRKVETIEEIVEDVPEETAIDVTANLDDVGSSVNEAFENVHDYDEVSDLLSDDELKKVIDEKLDEIKMDNSDSSDVDIEEQPVVDSEENSLKTAGDLEEQPVVNTEEDQLLNIEEVDKVISDQLDKLVPEENLLKPAGDLEEQPVVNPEEDQLLNIEEVDKVVSDQLDKLVPEENLLRPAGDLEEQPVVNPEENLLKPAGDLEEQPVVNPEEDQLLNIEEVDKVVSDQLDKLVPEDNSLRPDVDSDEKKADEDLEEFTFVNQNPMSLEEMSEFANGNNSLEIPDFESNVSEEDSNNRENYAVDKPLFEISYDDGPSEGDIGVDGYVVHKEDDQLDYNYRPMTDEEIKSAQDKLAEHSEVEAPIRAEIITVDSPIERTSEVVEKDNEEEIQQFITQDSDKEDEDDEIARLRELITAARLRNAEATKRNKEIIEQEELKNNEFRNTAEEETRKAEEAEKIQKKKLDSESRLNAAKERFEKLLKALEEDTINKEDDTKKHQEKVQSTEEQIGLLKDSIDNIDKNIDEDMAVISELDAKANQYDELVDSDEEVIVHK